MNPDGTDTAPSAGRFARGNPQATSSSGPKQLGTTPSGRDAFVTGWRAGRSPNSSDLDGLTTIRSAPIALPSSTGQQLRFRFSFAHDAKSTSADKLTAIVEAQDGTQTAVWSIVGNAADRDGAWRSAAISLDPWAGQTIHLRFQAVDGGPNNLVEVEVDDVRVSQPT